MPKLAAHALEHGITGLSLRPLARAAGTSDRMLIYHFGNKEQLIADLLAFIAADLTQNLTTALPPGPSTSRVACLTEVAGLMRNPAMRPYTQLWFDILAEAARGQSAHAQTSAAIMAGFVGWIRSRLPADDPDPEGCAAHLLVLVEGMVMMDAAGQPEVADAALAAYSG
ncbi:MAG: TetR/AcrR family transcriptional regulator [Paracoccaceae bacterium]